MTVHPHANAFDSSAQEYEKGRPGYPHSLLEWIESRGRLGAGCTVVDLGAGTGKLTRLLLESSARIIAIEPMAAMREQFRHILPDTELIDATAEALPLPDESIGMVTCGQSFRWFATDTALAEIARVLSTDGELVIIFNVTNDRSPLQRRLEQILQEVDTITEERKPGAKWRDVLLASPNFELVEETVLPHTQVMDRAGLSDRLHSSSQFSRLPSSRQDQLIGELASMVEDDTIELHHLTNVLRLRKIDLP